MGTKAVAVSHAENAVIYIASSSSMLWRRRNAPYNPGTYYDDSTKAYYEATSPEDLDSFIENNNLTPAITCQYVGDQVE